MNSQQFTRFEYQKKQNVRLFGRVRPLYSDALILPFFIGETRFIPQGLQRFEISFFKGCAILGAALFYMGKAAHKLGIGIL